MKVKIADPRINEFILDLETPERPIEGDIFIIDAEPWRCLQCVWFKTEVETITGPRKVEWALECAALPISYLEGGLDDAVKQ